MLAIASPRDIECLARAGRVVSSALDAACAGVRVGATPVEVAGIVERVLQQAHARAVLKGFVPAQSSGAQQGGAQQARQFPTAACVCVNEQVVHAVPSERALRAGDVVTIDTAAEVDGWHTDAARTVVVGEVESGHREVVGLARGACEHAVACCVAGRMWSSVVQSTREWVAERGGALIAGYHGHGIGRELHQAPTAWFAALPHEEPMADFELLPGLVLCVEPIVCVGKAAPTLVLASDGWTLVTRDRSVAAFEERCIAVVRGGGPPRVLAG